MLKDNQAFSGFSVDDLDKAEKFYSETLGLEVTKDEMGLHVHTNGNNPIFVYPKDNHEAATYTVLNFSVADIDKTVAALKEAGVTFEQYDLGGGAKTDDTGVMRGLESKMGPDIAWFKDPAGNVLSVLQDS